MTGRHAFVLLVVVLFSGWGCQHARSAKPASVLLASYQPNVVSTPPLLHRLSNGLTLALDPMPESRVVALELWVLAGSASEGQWSGSGVSHLLEHMVFQGAEGRQTGDLWEQVASMGGTMNAFTSRDATGYHLVVPREHVVAATELLADAVTRAQLPVDEFERERDVVIREIAMGKDDPQRRLSQALWTTAYQVHPYRHPVIGHQALLQQLSRTDLQNYYRERYRPDTAVLAIAGGFDIENLLPVIEESYGTWARNFAQDDVRVMEPTQLSQRRYEEVYAGRIALLRIAFPSCRLRNPDLFALDTLAVILGQGESSRLYRELVATGLAYGATAWSYTPKDPGLFAIQIQLDPQRLTEVEERLWMVLDELTTQPVEARELERAQQRVRADYIFERETAQGRARGLASSWLFAGSIQFHQRYVDGIGKISSHDVQQAARQYIRRDRTNSVLLSPDTQEAQVDPTTVATTHQTWQNWTLDNGLSVYLQEDHQLPTVSMVVAGLGGVRWEPADQGGAAQLANKLLLQGTATRTAEALAWEIERTGGSLSNFSGYNSAGMVARVLSEHTETAIKLMADSLRNPIFPPEEVDRLRAQQLAALDAQDQDIFSTTFRHLRSHVFPKHPYGKDPLGVRESLKSLTRQQLIELHTQRVTPNALSWVVVGDVTREQLDTWLSSYLNDWDAADSLPILLPHMTTVQQASQHQYVMEDKQQAVIAWGFRAAQITDPDRWPIEVMRTILSGAGASGRLWKALREQDGQAYTLGAWFTPGVDPGIFGLYVATTPEAVSAVRTELRRQIERLHDEPVSAEELVRAQRLLIGDHVRAQEHRSSRTMQAVLNVLYELGIDAEDSIPDHVNAVTIEDIQRVALRYLTLDAYAEVVVGPAKEESSTQNSTDEPQHQAAP